MIKTFVKTIVFTVLTGYTVIIGMHFMYMPQKTGEIELPRAKNPA
jgi:hypothetical protein